MGDTRCLVNSTQYTTYLVPYSSVLPLAEDTQETYFRDMGTEMATVLGLCSQQGHQTQEKVSKHQLAAKGKCTDCTGKEIPQKNCCPRLGRAKQRRSSHKSSPACCFLVLIESRSLSEAPNTGCGYQGRLSDLILLTV